MTMPDSVSGVAGKPRDVNYDLLRVVAMCLVIGVHVINNYMPVKMTLAGSAEVTRSVLFALFMVCNPLFIMVSGRFNLTFDADRPVRRWFRCYCKLLQRYHCSISSGKIQTVWSGALCRGFQTGSY